MTDKTTLSFSSFLRQPNADHTKENKLSQIELIDKYLIIATLSLIQISGGNTKFQGSFREASGCIQVGRFHERSSFSRWIK